MSEYRDKIVVVPMLWEDETVNTLRAVQNRRKARTAKRRTQVRLRTVRGDAAKSYGKWS